MEANFVPIGGAMTSLNLITVPLLLDLSTDAATLVSQWRRMYHYGHQTMPVLALGTFSLHVLACLGQYRAARKWRIFFIAAMTTIMMLPFTWFCMASTNNELFRLEEAGKASQLVMETSAAKELVTRWSWLHFARCLFPMTGVILGSTGLR